MNPRLKEIYKKDIQPALKDSLGLKNLYMIPISIIYRLVLYHYRT